jgi:hypothetical protein
MPRSISFATRGIFLSMTEQEIRKSERELVLERITKATGGCTPGWISYELKREIEKLKGEYCIEHNKYCLDVSERADS